MKKKKKAAAFSTFKTTRKLPQNYATQELKNKKQILPFLQIQFVFFVFKGFFR